MTTFELTELRWALEETLALETLPRCARSREELQQQLSEVITEEDERARIRRANTSA
jgi:predicted secreted Zn-dependent protease